MSSFTAGRFGPWFGLELAGLDVGPVDRAVVEEDIVEACGLADEAAIKEDVVGACCLGLHARDGVESASVFADLPDRLRRLDFLWCEVRIISKREGDSDNVASDSFPDA